MLPSLYAYTYHSNVLSRDNVFITIRYTMTERVDAYLALASLAVENPDRAYEWPLPNRVEVIDAPGGPELEIVYGEPYQLAEPRHNALESFLSLAASNTPRRVAAFVRRHGALRLSPEGLPDARWPEIARERVSYYRRYSNLLVSMLRTAARARRGQPPIEDDRSVIHGFVVQCAEAAGDEDWLGIYRHLLPEGAHNSGQVLVMLTLRWWRILGNPTVDFSWPVFRLGDSEEWEWGSPRVTWTGGLWGVLWSQAVRAVLSDLSPVTCTHCGVAIDRQRKPKDGQRAWCDRDECRRAAQRDRVARYRASLR
jgi:hypothetical protein